jgi:hypothetical protein
MNATLEINRAGVSFVMVQDFQMLFTVENALYRKKIEMAVQRL